MRRWGAPVLVLVVVVIAAIGVSVWLRGGPIRDEALRAGRDAASFPAATEDYFHDMDGGVALTPQEVQGRNTWLVWSGGNDRFWDGMTATTFGAFDLLKVVSSHPGLKFDRDTRWSYVAWRLVAVILAVALAALLWRCRGYDRASQLVGAGLKGGG